MQEYPISGSCKISSCSFLVTLVTHEVDFVVYDKNCNLLLGQNICCEEIHAKKKCAKFSQTKAASSSLLSFFFATNWINLKFLISEICHTIAEKTEKRSLKNLSKLGPHTRSITYFCIHLQSYVKISVEIFSEFINYWRRVVMKGITVFWTLFLFSAWLIVFDSKFMAVMKHLEDGKGCAWKRCTSRCAMQEVYIWTLHAL